MEQFGLDLGAAGVQPDPFEVLANGGKGCGQNVLLDLVLIRVLAVGADGIGVQPALTDLDQLGHQGTHLVAFAKEGTAWVGGEGDARVIDLVIAGSSTGSGRALGSVLDDIVKDLVGAVQLRAPARGQVAQGSQDVEGRTAATFLLRGVQGLVIEAILHAHAIALLQGQAQQVDLVLGVAVSLLWAEATDGPFTGGNLRDAQAHVSLKTRSQEKGFFSHQWYVSGEWNLCLMKA